MVTNGIYATGGRATVSDSTTNRVAVDKPLTLRSINGPQFTIIDGGGFGFARCVYLTNGANISGFTLTNGFAVLGGGVFCESTNAVVSNCALSGNSAFQFSDYQGLHPPVPHGGGAYGGTLNACTLTNNWAFFNEHPTYNPPQFTGYGGGASYCALNNCKLAGNRAGGTGGGAESCVLNNCTMSSNSADSAGGGASGCTLNNCALSGNSADGNFAGTKGGGAFGCTLNNCTLTSNSAAGTEGEDVGGGANYSTLNNCIVYFNAGANYAASTLNYCCTTPKPTNGVGNITNAPLFVDTNGWANLRMQSNSPCINAGNNPYVMSATDLDGNPRIAGGSVDIGAYEFQSPTSIISYAWLQQYGLPTDGSADFADPDGDGLNDWQEWRGGTSPIDASSVLKILGVVPGRNSVTVTWQSVPGVTYFIQSSTNLAGAFTTVRDGITADPAIASTCRLFPVPAACPDSRSRLDVGWSGDGKDLLDTA